MANLVPLVLGADGLPQRAQAADTAALPGGISVAGSATFAGVAGFASLVSTSGYFQATGVGALGQIEYVSGGGTTWWKSGWRADANTLYLLLTSAQSTQAAAVAAGFNALRPFYVDLATGRPVIDGTGVGTVIGGGLTAGGAAVIPAKPVPMGVTTITTDADATFTLGTTKAIVRHTATLTANRTLTLGAGAEGNGYRVVRTGGGSFTLSVGGLKSLAQNTWSDVAWDATSGAWVLTGYGSL